MKYPITTQRQIRDRFWADHPNLDHQARLDGTRSKPQNAQRCSTRLAFCDFLDDLQRDGCISEALAQKATL